MVNISFTREILFILACATILRFYELWCFRILAQVFESSRFCCKSCYCVSWHHVWIKFYGLLESYPPISPEFELYCHCFYYFFSPLLFASSLEALVFLPCYLSDLLQSLLSPGLLLPVIGICICVCNLFIFIYLFCYTCSSEHAVVKWFYFFIFMVCNSPSIFYLLCFWWVSLSLFFLQAMFEGILVDIPFATFFLSKLKQK